MGAVRKIRHRDKRYKQIISRKKSVQNAMVTALIKMSYELWYSIGRE